MASDITVAILDGGSTEDYRKLKVDSSGNLLIAGTVTSSVANQYTEGDVDASITGIAILGEAPSNTLQPLQLDASNFLKVTQQGTVTITGSVTANAGTNLNTSLLALESGGNLAGAATSLAIIDDWDESDRAKVNPIVGQAGVQGASGVVTALTQRVVLATDVALPAGTNVIGHVILDSGSTTTVTQATASSLNATVVGTGTFAVQSTIAASATNIAKAEDAASANADVGVPAMAIRKATPANTSDTDGDYEMLQMSAGRLWVDASGVTLTVASHNVTNAGTFAVQAAITAASGSIASGAISSGAIASGALASGSVSSGAIASGAIASGAFASGSVASGAFASGSISAGAIAAGASSFVKLEDVASADADAGVACLAVRKATPANTSGTDGDYEFMQISAGRLWTSATIDAALPAGTNAIGKLSSNSGVTIGAVEIAAAQTLATVTTVSTVTAVTAITNALPTGTNTIGGVNPTPSGAAAQATTNATSTAYEASRVVKASAGTVYGLTGYSSKSTAQFIQLFNSTTVPADGGQAVVTFTVPGLSNFSIDFGVYGRRFSTGIAISNSSTSPTKTLGSADCFFDVQYV